MNQSASHSPAPQPAIAADGRVYPAAAEWHVRRTKEGL